MIPFFFYARSTPPPTTNGCDFQNCVQSNRIPCLSTHTAPHVRWGRTLAGGNAVAIGFPGPSRVRLSNSGPLPSSNYTFFCRCQSHHMLLMIVKLKSVHFKYTVTNDRLLRSNTILVSGPYASRFVSKDQKANAGRQLPAVRSQNQKSKRRKRCVIEFSTTSGRVEDAGYRRRR